MAALFEQTIILFLFISAGFGLAKAKIVHAEHSKILSELLVYIFLPCNCIMAFSKNFTVEYITQNYVLLIGSSVMMLIVGVTMHFVAKPFAKKKYDRFIYEYSLAMPNYGGVGYPLVLGVLGEAGLLDFMVYCIPIGIYVYTYAYNNLTKRTVSLSSIFSLKTLFMILNPSIVAMFIGMIMGITGFTLPSALNSAVNTAGSCLAPVAMIIVGVAISDFNMKKLLSGWQTYVVTAMRLLVIPIAAGFIMKLLNVPDVVFTYTVIFLAIPCGMNTITLPKLFDENCEIGASLALVSNVAACATIPLVLYIFGIGAA